MGACSKGGGVLNRGERAKSRIYGNPLQEIINHYNVVFGKMFISTTDRYIF